jgi:hypothetical protein
VLPLPPSASPQPWGRPQLHSASQHPWGEGPQGEECGGSQRPALPPLLHPPLVSPLGLASPLGLGSQLVWVASAHMQQEGALGVQHQPLAPWA